MNYKKKKKNYNSKKKKKNNILKIKFFLFLNVASVLFIIYFKIY